MAASICIQCGAAKGTWGEPCKVCHSDPKGDKVALAESYILSEERYDLPGPDAVPLEAFEARQLDAIGKGFGRDAPTPSTPCRLVKWWRYSMQLSAWVLGT
jgi:hypothetical protein